MIDLRDPSLTAEAMAGAPLALDVPVDGLTVVSCTLGPILGTGHRLQHLAPRTAWQSARSLGAWTLVTCTVAPAFSFAGFELAPPGWRQEMAGEASASGGHEPA